MVDVCLETMDFRASVALGSDIPYTVIHQIWLMMDGDDHGGIHHLGVERIGGLTITNH